MDDQMSSLYQHIYDYASLEDRWHDVYDRHCRSQSRAFNPYFEVPKYLSAWDNQNSMDTSGGESTGSLLGLEELRRAALEGMHSLDTPLDTLASDEGEYKTIPLEGRFDLMRPLTRTERKQRKQVPSIPSSSKLLLSLPSHRKNQMTRLRPPFQILLHSGQHFPHRIPISVLLHLVHKHCLFISLPSKVILHFISLPLLVTSPLPLIHHNHFRSGMRLHAPIFRLRGLVERIHTSLATQFAHQPCLCLWKLLLYPMTPP